MRLGLLAPPLPIVIENMPFAAWEAEQHGAWTTPGAGGAGMNHDRHWIELCQASTAPRSSLCGAARW